MDSPVSSSLLRWGRRLVFGLLAIALPLQGMAAGIVTVLGPAHFHRSEVRVLDDFRRAAPAAPHATAGAGDTVHFHGPGTPLRHHHAPDDASVVAIAEDAAAPESGSDKVVSPSLAAFVALLAALSAWAWSASGGNRLPLAGWSWRTNVPARLERPPRID